MEPEYPFVLVMDRAEQSLQALLSTQRIAGHDKAEIVRLFDSITCNVAELHYGGVLHNDLKPRNILLDGEGQVILCDLDAAVPLFDLQSSGETTQHVRSRDAKGGSSGYYSPEVARWEADVSLPLGADCASDVWSLGVILFELSSGRNLFHQDINDDNLVSIRDKQRLHSWNGISEAELAEVLPNEDTETREAAKALIRWCLMGDPADRPSIEQIRGHRFLRPKDGWLQELGAPQEPQPAGVEKPVLVRDQLRMRYHAMITHYQAEASGDTGALASALRNVGMHVWRDVDMGNLTLPGMCQGVMDSDVLIVMLTNAVLSRWYCLMEIKWALAFGKQIIFVQETEERFLPWDYDRWVSNKCSRRPSSLEWEECNALSVPFEKCQADFPEVIAEVARQVENGQLIAYRRRDFERDGTMVPEIMRRAADPTLPTYAPLALRWGLPLPQASLVGASMADSHIFIVYNLETGEEIKQHLEGCLQRFCGKVSSSADSEPEGLIRDATHFVALLTEDVVSPGEESLAQMELTLSQGRPMEFVFRPPFFEDHMGAAPSAVQDALRGKEALENRSLEYEREGMVTELLKRLLSNATALSDASLTTLHDGVPPPPTLSVRYRAVACIL